MVKGEIAAAGLRRPTALGAVRLSPSDYSSARINAVNPLGTHILRPCQCIVAAVYQLTLNTE